MKPCKLDPVEKDDVLHYLDTASDFAFEVEVFRLLTEMGFLCEHGGTYTDPVTGKDRAFDIRARWSTRCYQILLAVECKNLRPSLPLLAHCVPRTQQEAFHTACLSVDPEKVELEHRGSFNTPDTRQRCKNIRNTGRHSLYGADEPVAKACVQVSKKDASGKAASDSDVFERWSQALNSADDLIRIAAFAGENGDTPLTISLVIPLLVVPDGRMWIVNYDDRGKRTGDPDRVDHCAYFVNKPYYVNDANCSDPFTISHVAFVTLSGLQEFLKPLLDHETTRSSIFALEIAKQSVHRVRR